MPTPDDFDLLFHGAKSFADRRYRPCWVTQVDLHLSDGRVVSLPVPSFLFEELCRTAENRPPEPPDGPGPGFRSFRWHETVYPLTPKQSKVVAVLWDAYQAGTPDVPQDLLLRAAESECVRLVDLFRNSSTWQKLVVTGDTAGTYRLGGG